jgi:hypothetical protein
LHLVRRVGLAKDLRNAGLDGLAAALRQDHLRCLEPTLHRVLAWAQTAAAPDAAAATHRQIALVLEEDRQQKQREIQALERQLAGVLARTEYIVLLSIPGINVVTASEYAGEMGPITRYANPKTITGRAGLYPSRAQSDQVDHADGPLIRCANRQLRYAILQIADCLIKCNKYFAAINECWKAAGKDPRHNRVRVGSRFVRISYHMLAAGNVFRHPFARDRSYIVQKLLEFHRTRGTSIEQRLADSQAAIEQLPKHAYAAEAAPLMEELETIRQRRRRGPQPIGEILPLLLARLGIASGESKIVGDHGPR